MTTRYERLSSRSRRLEVVAAVAAATLTVVMCCLVPGRAADVAEPTAGRGRVAVGASPGGAGAERLAPLGSSAPVHVSGAGVDADVVAARRAGGVLPPAVPDRPMEVVWDASGPAPGEDGPAALIGLLDSRSGPAAFAGLGGLRAGAHLRIDRADGRTARFRVQTVERYGPDGPPGFLLAAAPAEDGPQLRLLGRGGGWTEKDTDDATVVVSARAAP